MDPLNEMPDAAPSPAAEAALGQRREKIELLLATLPDRYRLPLVFHYFHGLSQKEIGEMLGRPEGTVAVQIRRGLKKLEPLLRRTGIDEGPPAVALAAVGLGLLDPPISAAGASIWSAAQAALALRVVSTLHAASNLPLISGPAVKAALAGTLLLLCAGGVTAWINFKKSPPPPAATLPVAAPPSVEPGSLVAASATVEASARSALPAPKNLPSDTPVSPLTTLGVSVVDPEGAPVAGAEIAIVHLIMKKDSRHPVLQLFRHTMSGNDGVALFTALPRNRSTPWLVAGRVPGKSTGAAFHYSVSDDQWTSLVLRPSRTFRAIVKVPPGFDPTSVSLKVLSFGAGRADNLVVPEEMLEHLTWVHPVNATKEGEVVLDDLPYEPLWLEASGPGLGRCGAWIPGRQIDSHIAFNLRPEAVIEGTVLGPQGPVSNAHVTLTVRSYVQKQVNVSSMTDDWVTSAGRLEGPPRDSLRVLSAVTDRAGRFRVDQLPEAIYTVQATPGPGSLLPAVVAPVVILRPEPRSLAQVELRFETGATVEGRVVDSATGAGLERVTVIAKEITAPELPFARVQTDINGLFEMRLPLGQYSVSISSPAEGYRIPLDQNLSAARGDSSAYRKQVELTTPDQHVGLLTFKLDRLTTATAKQFWTPSRRGKRPQPPLR